MTWACAIDYEPNDLLVEHEINTARKEHVCAYCGCKIPVGCAYGKWVWLYDGEFGEEKYHHECKALMYEAAEALCGESVIAFGSTLDGASRELLSAEVNDQYWGYDDFVKKWMILLGDVWEIDHE